MIDYSVVKQGLLLQDGRTLLKVSTVHQGCVACQVLLEGSPSKPPARDSVRSYTKTQVEAMSLASDRLVSRARDVYRNPAARVKTKTCPNCSGTGKVSA